MSTNLAAITSWPEAFVWVVGIFAVLVLGILYLFVLGERKFPWEK